MKPRFANQTNRALMLVEVFVVVAVLAVVAAILLPALAASRRKSARIGCVQMLKEMGLAYRIWGGDNGDKYAMGISVTNGGAMELIATGNMMVCFQVMSNELSTPRTLHCPEDSEHFAANSFAELASSNISYFINIDATEAYPQMLLSGDDNFEINGVPVKSGLLEFSTNTPISWTAARHKFIGNLAIADGSVQQVTQSGLRSSIVVTNRLAIP
jgi:hypothetical protein